MKSKLILLSHPQPVMGEVDTMEELFAMGLPLFHLRKEGFTEQLYTNFLNRIHKPYRDKIILHEYPALAEKYGLYGAHQKSTFTGNPLENCSLQQSKSIHSFAEVEQNKAYDTLYLSPVYDSVSKKNHPSQFSEEELTTYFKQEIERPKIYALGGVTPQNCKATINMGFDGVVMLGSIWNNIFVTKLKQQMQIALEELEVV